MNSDISEILANNKEYIEQYDNKINYIRTKIAFCVDHKFSEEARILRIELDAIDLLFYRYKNMYEDINELYK